VLGQGEQRYVKGSEKYPIWHEEQEILDEFVARGFEVHTRQREVVIVVHGEHKLVILLKNIWLELSQTHVLFTRIYVVVQVIQIFAELQTVHE
jgi:hypothetical protein